MKIAAKQIAPGAANTVLVTNGAGTAVVETLLVNANVDAAAAIAGTKIDPNFGVQNVSTSGTLGAGASTLTSLTISGLTTGIAHVGVAGAITSSLIVNADIAAGAAVALSKLAPGAADTVLVTNGAGTAVVTAKLVNANVDAAAAIAVSKLAPGANGQALITTAGVAAWGNDFGAQNLTTTGALFLNASAVAATAHLRFGPVGTGAGTGAAATLGSMRIGDGWFMEARNAADTLNFQLDSWSGGVRLLGAGNTYWQYTPSGNMVLSINGTTQATLSTTSFLLGGAANTLALVGFVAGSVAKAMGGLQGGVGVTSAGAIKFTGHDLLGDAAIAVTAGNATFQAGSVLSAPGANTTGGLTTIAGGDTTLGSGTQQGGNLLARPGVGDVYGNVAFMAEAPDYKSMEAGIFIGNTKTLATADPTLGFFVESDGAKPLFRWSGGRLRLDAAAATATAGAGILPITPEEFMLVQFKGNARTIPMYLP